MRRARSVSTIEVEPDHVLSQRAAEGDSRAFEELYRRHAPAAWRMAYAVAGNADDAADAVSDAFTRVFQALPTGRLQAVDQFRPYLLASTRNAAIDGLRRQGRIQPTATVDDLDRPGADDLPSDRVLDSVDSRMVAVAFRSLPERWRSVLWLTEVEGIPAREAAPMLGVSANGLAQLAVRARAGLRQRFLQAHLRAPVARSCQFPVDKLGAYVAGGLSPRETARVDQHLAGCADCRQQVEELEDLGSLLRRVVTPVPLALAAVSMSKWKLAAKLASTVTRNPAFNQARKPIAAAAAALFALGVIGATILDRPDSDSNPSTAAGPRSGQNDGDGPAVERNLDSLPPAQQAGNTSPNSNFENSESRTGGTGSGRGDSNNAGGSGGSGGNGGEGDGGAPGPGDGDGDGPEPPPAEPPIQVYVLSNTLSTNAGLGVGDGSCTGLELLALTTLGCQPPPSDGLLELRLNDTSLGL